ncbi:pentraxin fusion protein-like [Leucoraja erinacea]|uniref:pentraxin fusion protein-like n=1 Tax=Leucoraja erinaceus TaxID=7782 RepID=UPI00245757E9|nr:pentraxin fusion protein-like [Leucoraja erinacea]
MKLPLLCVLACLCTHGLAAPDNETNVAPGGRATQSSNERSAGRAVDGKTGDKDSCAVTDSDTDPWWRLDLLEKHQVWSVRITNTDGDPRADIDGADIRIGDSFHNHGNDNPRCAAISSIGLNAVESFDCGGMQGRFVNVVRRGKRERLTLCEVEVFAQPLFLIRAC